MRVCLLSAARGVGRGSTKKDPLCVLPPQSTPHTQHLRCHRKIFCFSDNVIGKSAFGKSFAFLIVVSNFSKCFLSELWSAIVSFFAFEKTDKSLKLKLLILFWSFKSSLFLFFSKRTSISEIMLVILLSWLFNSKLRKLENSIFVV